MQFDTLDIVGLRGEAVPNRFLRQDGATDRLAIVLPGLGQSADTPHLYFINSHFLVLRADVLLVDYQYGQRADYRALDADERQRWLIADTAAACRAALLAQGRRALVVIGTADPHYDPHVVEEVRRATDGELLVIADAEHGLEIEGDVLRSVQALEEMVRAVVRFVRR